MRDPVHEITADTPVIVWSGNQASGPGGNPGNQLQTGSAVLVRPIGDATWTEHPLAFSHAAGNNVHYSVTLPAGTFATGDAVQYYLRIPYGDHDTTYVYGSDEASAVSATEAVAQAAPFGFSVEPPLQPVGEYLALVDGDVEARVYEATGQIEVVGPGHDGRPRSIALLPGRARLNGNWFQIAAVESSTRVAGAIDLVQHLGPRQVEATLSVVAPGVFRYEVTDWGGPAPEQTGLGAASPDTEHFYGFGEKFNDFDQTGNVTRVVTSDPPGDKGDQSYKAAPWFLSTQGYGLQVDSTAVSTFDLRSTRPDRWSATVEEGELAYELVHGPALTDVLSRYTERTGRTTLPPPWVFGPWMSTDHWRDGGEVRYVVTRMVEEGIPGSVFVFDSPWETAYNDFSWNMTQFGEGGTYDGRSWDGFASVGDMMSFLRSHGFRVVVWLTPFINVSSVNENVPGQNTGESANYAAAAAAGYLVREGAGGPPLVVDWWKGQGSPVDFTNPAARTWFADQLLALVDESDGVISGFKTDDGEGTFVPDEAAYFDGRTGAVMKNGYTVEYHHTMGEILGDQGVLFSRSGYTGTQAYPGVWSGDNEPNFGDANGLPSVIVAGQSAAMSGYSTWGHDIGGYQDVNLSSTPENLFMRWTQFGAFSPIMQMHRQVALEMQYPWSFGQDGLDNYRTYARLHTELFPYVYSHAAIAADTGIPIMRPLVLDHPGDPETWPIRHTYRFGASLLVAPMVTNDQTERDVYLPSGTWYDFWTHEPIAGGRHYTWQGSDQSTFPVFVSAGAIIPLLTQVPQTLNDADWVGNPEIATPDGGWTVRVYPSGESDAFSAYDGTGVTVTSTEAVITIEHDGPARALRYEVVAAPPLAVLVDGDALAGVDDVAALDDTEAGWALDGTRVVAKLPHGRDATVLEIWYEEPPAGGTDAGGTVGADTTVGGGSEGGPGGPGSNATNGGTGDTSPADGDGGGGGCGCHAPRPSDGPTAMWATVLAIGASTRRRRRRTLQ